MEPYIGQISLFGFTIVPTGWLRCDGQLLSISTYSALYSLIGTIYGGDGITNFRLPDLRSRSPIGQSSSYTIGEQYGVENVSLFTAHLPSHAHAMNASTANPNSALPQDAFPAAAANAYSPNNSNATMTQTSQTGSSSAHTNMAPYMTISFCIAYQGIYPTHA